DQRADALLGESLDTFRELGHSNGIAVVLTNLAEVASRRGDLSRAAALYKECLDIYDRLENQQGIANSLEGLAALMALRGDPLLAGRLFGAAATLREAAGSPLPASEQPDHDQKIAAARSALDEASWEAAWMEGRRMPLAQVITMVTSWTGGGRGEQGSEGDEVP